MHWFRLVYGLVGLLLLAACSDGSSSITIIYPPNGPAQEPNTSPEIKGNLSKTVKAEEQTGFSFDIEDAQNDEMTISIDNPPEWLSYESDQEELRVTVKPSFFDIGNFRFGVTIDDGELSRDYMLEFAVQDNPEAYQIQSVVADELVGTWELKSSHIFHLFESGEGLYVDAQKQEFQIRWEVDRSNTAFFEFYSLTCFECGKLGEMEMQVVAQQEDLQHWLIRDDEGEFASNTLPALPPRFEDGFYMPLAASVGTLGNVDVSSQNLSLPATIKVNNDELDVVFKGKLDSSGQTVTFADELSSQAPLFENYLTTFFDQVNGVPLGLRFDFFAHELSLTYSDTHYLIVDAAITPQLSDENNHINIDDFVGLQDFLDTPVSTRLIFGYLTSVDANYFQPGRTYFSRYSGSAVTTLNGEEITVVGASEIVLDEEGVASIVFKLAGDASFSQAQNREWEVSGNRLSLASTSDTVNYLLFQNNQSEYFLAGYPLGDEEVAIYPVVELAQETSLIPDWDGQYLHNTFRDFTSQDINYLNIKDDRLEFLTNNVNISWSDRWKSNADDSIDIISGAGLCGSFSVDYDQCRGFHQDNFETRLIYAYSMRRMKLVKIEGNRHYFTYHFIRMDKSSSGSGIGSLRVFEKLEN